MRRGQCKRLGRRAGVASTVWCAALAATAALLAAAPSAAPAQSAPTPAGPASVTPAASAASVPIAPGQLTLLERWFARVGERRATESFGQLVIRAGRDRLTTPYALHPPTDGPEVLRVELDTLECVSFVETTLALARCVWKGQPEPRCFVGELESWRYRGGRLVDYPSRLHYFADWIADNEARGRVEQITATLGGQPQRLAHHYMTRNAAKFPPLRRPEIRAAIAAAEQRLSQTELVLLDRAQVAAAEPALESGDLVAIVNALHPGSGVGHVGFVDRQEVNLPRLLHASSYRNRVLLTAEGVAKYMTRRADRQAIMVVRPLPPP